MALLPTPKNAPRIGQCIYCDSFKEPLGKEHAVPYGLNGPWTLRKASCRDCADTTSQFERGCVREFLGPIRIALRMQTRRLSERATTLPLVLGSDGPQHTVRVSVEEYPAYLPTPVFPPPGAVSERRPTAGITLESLKFFHLAGPSFESLAERHHSFVGARVRLAPEDYARMLAKAAFCAAVQAVGLAPLRNSPLRAVILGKDPCVGHWVGSWTGPQENEPVGLHAMKVRASGSVLHVILRLFAQFGAPEYHVVLGAVDREFTQAPTWPWKPPVDG
jgi:hypothetical protein